MFEQLLEAGKVSTDEPLILLYPNPSRSSPEMTRNMKIMYKEPPHEDDD